MTRLYRLLHFGHTRLMVCVTTLSSALPALLLQHGVLSLRDFIVASYPLHLYNTTFYPVCKVFYYINSVVLQYHVSAPIAYRASIALVLLVYRVGICYHISMGVKTKQREVRIEYMRLDEIQRDAENPKLHDLGALAESFERFDFVSPLGISEKTGKLLWGHGRLDGLIAFMDEGKPALDGIQVDDDGMWKAPVVRGVHLNSKDGTAYVITDNRQVELGGLNEPKLVETLIRLAGKDGRGLRGTGYDGDDVDTLIRLYRPDLIDMPEDPGPQISRAEELQEKWQIERGQIWEIGRHKLVCGDARVATNVNSFEIEGVDIVLTDPPYSSGGFQEAQRKTGSIGSRQNIKIAADQLSTRGYISLMSEVLAMIQSDILYIFTDWRMWCWTYDIAERANYPVRNMLVWDKGVMGMGFPWRSTHELILFAKRTSSSMMDGKVGNVLHFERAVNKLHPTIKPVELFVFLLKNSPAGNIYDPFIGSGTTMVAAEQLNRICYGMEIEPKYCAVTLERMSGMGLEPRLVTP